MEMNKKTLEEHCEYVREMARLSFYFAYMLQRKLPEESLSDILRNHTPFYYHAMGYLADLPRPEFEAVAADSANEFEEKMYGRLQDAIMKRAIELYPSSMQVGNEWNCGSLRYGTPEPSIPGWCTVHITNAVAPDSIFTDPAYLPKCFLKLMDDSEKEYAYTMLYAGTWLNDKDKWLALFPEEWQKNLTPHEIQIPSWHTGHWGQLITARGTFNYKGGDFARQNGYLKYAVRYSHCSYTAMREYLKSIL